MSFDVVHSDLKTIYQANADLSYTGGNHLTEDVISAATAGIALRRFANRNSKGKWRLQTQRTSMSHRRVAYRVAYLV